MRTFRKSSQAVFLLLFLFLFIQTESKGEDILGYPVKIFLDFDPLIALSTVLSSHVLRSGLLFAIILVVLTALVGRVFCGWICPLGTLHNMVSALKIKRKSAPSFTLYKMKYCILFFILGSSLFTVQLAGIFDPLSLLVRSLSLSIYPAFNYVVRSSFDTIFAVHPPLIVNVSELIYTWLRNSVLSFQQPFFLQGTFIGLLFLGILLLNCVERRFWCKYLCPLGALLGLLSRFSLLNRSVSEGCRDCRSCGSICQGGSASTSERPWRKSDCLYCFDCDDACPHNAVSFGWKAQKTTGSLDLGKRSIVMSISAGILTVPLLRTGAPPRAGSLSGRLIRPPGALDEKGFLRTCIRCAECMKVCITNGLQPTLLEAGIEGIWSPVLTPTIGYCEYNCTLCGQVCPTGAIERLALEEKRKIKIGMAIIDRGRCLPHAFAIPCLVCEEVCPVPTKAIWLESVVVIDREEKEVLLRQPHVDVKQCIGCGICETKCPVIGSPAIYVANTGESRSEANQLQLF